MCMCVYAPVSIITYLNFVWWFVRLKIKNVEFFFRFCMSFITLSTVQFCLILLHFYSLLFFFFVRLFLFSHWVSSTCGTLFSFYFFLSKHVNSRILKYFLFLFWMQMFYFSYDDTVCFCVCARMIMVELLNDVFYIK